MKYMLLIYTAEDAGPAVGSPEAELEMKRYFEFSQEVAKKGLVVGGDPLEPAITATTVRVRDGKRLTTDGPFAETKEVLGGYYILDCENLDQALEYAAKIPGAEYGSVEVRPVMAIPGM
jgi:hypothetical protein